MLWCSATQNRRNPSRSACWASWVVSASASADEPPSRTTDKSSTESGITGTTIGSRPRIVVVEPVLPTVRDMFEWSEEHQMIREAMKDFIAKEIVPIRDELEHGDTPPYEVLRKLYATFGIGEQ